MSKDFAFDGNTLAAAIKATFETRGTEDQHELRADVNRRVIILSYQYLRLSLEPFN